MLVGARLDGQPRALEGLDVDVFDPLEVLDSSEAVVEFFPSRVPRLWRANGGVLSVENGALQLIASGDDPQFITRTSAESSSRSLGRPRGK